MNQEPNEGKSYIVYKDLAECILKVNADCWHWKVTVQICLWACPCPSSSSAKCMTGTEGVQGNSCVTLDYHSHLPHHPCLYHAYSQTWQMSYIISLLSLWSSEEHVCFCEDSVLSQASQRYKIHTHKVVKICTDETTSTLSTPFWLKLATSASNVTPGDERQREGGKIFTQRKSSRFLKCIQHNNM